MHNALWLVSLYHFTIFACRLKDYPKNMPAFKNLMAKKVMEEVLITGLKVEGPSTIRKKIQLDGNEKVRPI